MCYGYLSWQFRQHGGIYPVEEYERSWEQNEELGLNDMDTSSADAAYESSNTTKIEWRLSNALFSFISSLKPNSTWREEMYLKEKFCAFDVKEA